MCRSIEWSDSPVVVVVPFFVAVIVVAGFAGEETRDMWAFDVQSKAWEDWSAHRYEEAGNTHTLMLSSSL